MPNRFKKPFKTLFHRNPKDPGEATRSDLFDASGSPPAPSSANVQTPSSTAMLLGRPKQPADTGNDIVHHPKQDPILTGAESLWDRAYDELKHDDPEHMDEYEELLSQALTYATPTSGDTSVLGDGGGGGRPNQIPQHDPTARREKMEKITVLGLKHMKTKEVSVTLLGHKLELQKAVAGAATAAHWAEDYIGDAVKDVPYASAVWAGIALALPLLKNPVESQTKNQEGFEYVTSQICYYAEMESLLLPEEMAKGLKSNLTDRLVALYKLIIEFQVATILLFYRSRTKNYVRGIIKYDEWEEKLQAVKENGADVSRKFRDALQGQNLKTLEKLAAAAETIRQIAEAQARDIANMARRLSDSKRLEALKDLRTTDPRHDKQRIESDKGGLLSDVYDWILENAEFKEWRDDDQRQLLWIKGDPGKGKTMLLCGIINELKISAGRCLSYFFCQATEVRLNSSTSVLRGLMYMLIDHQPWLARHVQK
ncbi:hypothetical protein GQ53DRAFT_546788, partial [Thozetella sp. PMI_491]